MLAEGKLAWKKVTKDIENILSSAREDGLGDKFLKQAILGQAGQGQVFIDGNVFCKL